MGGGKQCPNVDVVTKYHFLKTGFYPVRKTKQTSLDCLQQDWNKMVMLLRYAKAMLIPP